MMTFDEVKELLSGATRYELRDHAFGDAEVYWRKEGSHDEIAWGYFSARSAEVSGRFPFRYEGDQARELRKCGTLVVDRNDETGPDEYAEGKTMPGLTLEGVRKELTGE